MPIPSYPTNLIPRPFASNGTFQIIPDAKTTAGRASWQEGFPVETQLPLANGGIAPSRPDFNGVLNMLSSLGYWQQAGGLFIYSTSQDYNTPSMVFHDNMLWFCKVPNGPDTTSGVKTPGIDSDYWISFLEFLAGGSGSSSLGVPVGTVLSFYGDTAPEGYFLCNGDTFDTQKNPNLFSLLGSSNTPDLRGVVIRGNDPNAARDPDGASRAFGSIQDFSMEKMTGSFTACFQNNQSNSVDGVFTRTVIGSGDAGNIPNELQRVFIDSSLQVKTSTETRMVNVNLSYIIKHD